MQSGFASIDTKVVRRHETRRMKCASFVKSNHGQSKDLLLLQRQFR
jgi:hypothetical protein